MITVESIAEPENPNREAEQKAGAVVPGQNGGVMHPGRSVAHGRSAPSTSREIFELFASYQPETGLKSLFQGVDLTAVDRRRIYYAVHGRAPETPELLLDEGFLPLNGYIAALTSEEFRSNIVQHLLTAFPERKRLLFVHIPRTAGSELSARLMDRYPSLNGQLTWADWRTPEEFFSEISRFVLESGSSDSVFVHGHNTLEQYRAWRVIRFRDSIFTVAREPVEMMVSQINYVLTRIFAEEIPPKPDTLAWRTTLGVEAAAGEPSKSQALALARKALYEKDIIPPNIMCHYLGDGTADGAIANVIIHAAEITDFDHYGAWFRERWGIDTQSRSNFSKAYINADDLTDQDVDYIASATSEDAKFYMRLQQAFAKRGGTSIVGKQIV